MYETITTKTPAKTKYTGGKLFKLPKPTVHAELIENRKEICITIRHGQMFADGRFPDDEAVRLAREIMRLVALRERMEFIANPHGAIAEHGVSDDGSNLSDGPAATFGPGAEGLPVAFAEYADDAADCAEENCNVRDEAIDGLLDDLSDYSGELYGVGLHDSVS